MSDQSAPMDATELRECLDIIGWSQHELARRAERDPSRVRKMARAAEPIDPDLAYWLRIITAPLRENPIPPKPQQRKTLDTNGF